MLVFEIFPAKFPAGVHHIDQQEINLLPNPVFETAVGVNKRLIPGAATGEYLDTHISFIYTKSSLENRFFPAQSFVQYNVRMNEEKMFQSAISLSR